MSWLSDNVGARFSGGHVEFSGWVSCITGVWTGPMPGATPSIYETAPALPPKPREWVNGDDKVWIVTIEYRKPSLGDAGVLGTYKTFERAKQELNSWAEYCLLRSATEEELAEGAIYTEDASVEIVERTLE